MSDSLPDSVHGLLRLVPAGDERAIRTLLERELPRLRAFVRLRMNAQLRGREESSDLIQSTCRELLENAGAFEFRGDAQFSAWLCKAALNKILERERYHRAERRDSRREQPLGPGGEAALVACYAHVLSPSGEAIVRERIAAIEAAFDRLPETYREVITYSRVLGLSHAEIAEQLGKSEVAVRSLLHRALAHLTTLLHDPSEGS